MPRARRQATSKVNSPPGNMPQQGERQTSSLLVGVVGPGFMFVAPMDMEIGLGKQSALAGRHQDG